MPTYLNLQQQKNYQHTLKLPDTLSMLLSTGRIVLQLTNENTMCGCALRVDTTAVYYG